jgi:hypothetical protein
VARWEEEAAMELVASREEAIAILMEWVVSLLRERSNHPLLEQVRVLEVMVASQTRDMDNFRSNLLQTILKITKVVAMILKPSDINLLTNDISLLNNSQTNQLRLPRKSERLVLLDLVNSDI